ncbi:MAG: alpha/beta hydrolase [Ignavibacteriae bacterium]|nr:alpha/beta hydrolase [Ignavibacteriota bacterium]
MVIKATSFFKNPTEDNVYFNDWVNRLEQLNGKKYTRIEVETSLGKTHIWGLNTEKKDCETVVIFPGARTTSLFWDLNNGLKELEQNFRIFMVDTNGLPNLSDGKTPDIKSLEYGEWASEILEKLNISKIFIAGASFGGLICMKLSIVAPEKVKAAFLLNPGCLQPFSMSFKNLYYNLLPIIFPKKKNVRTFLDKAIFCAPTHSITEQWMDMIIDYEVFALTRYKDNTQKPYFMGDELKKIKTDIYLLEGDKDMLFPYQVSIDNAKKYINSLKEIKIFENVGHGIEIFPKALQFIDEKCKEINVK